MTEPGTPHHAVDRPKEKKLWTRLPVTALLIVGALVVWWGIEFAGNVAKRDLDEPEIEPFEPALERPAPPVDAPPPDPWIVRAV